ncbi:MAG: hypothetical protein VX951_12485 [Planctomycetota bacterium]|nr:hypothetical protein [Planctomycetota bacterium]
MKRVRRQMLLLVGWSVLATDLAQAQIDVINHRQWAWLMQRRRELQAAVQDLPVVRQGQIAEALTQCKEAVPLLSWARAMAIAKGVKADAAFRFRAGLQVLAMPEVVSKEAFDHVAVTIHAAHAGLTGELPLPKAFRFAVRVADAKGRQVWTGTIENVDDMRALREFRVTCKVPIEKLADGDYRVLVDAILDDKPARAHDVVLSVGFSVLHGYKKRGGYFRVGAVTDGVAAALAKLEPLPRAVLRGAAEFASRPYFGMPGLDSARGVRDLRRAEAILKNIRADKPPLAGLQGYVDIALPCGDNEIVFATPRLPAGGLPAPDSKAWRQLARRPLMLFLGRRPSWDVQGRRPSHPRFALPAYLATALDLAGFDEEGRFQVLVLESPGRIPSSRFQIMLSELSAALPCDVERMILVGEGQGAGVAVDLALARPEHVAGLVLVGNSGGLATPQLRKLKAVSIVALTRHGDVPGAASIGLLRTYSKHAGTSGGLEIDPWVKKLPWSIAIPMVARQLELFGAKVSTR